MLVAAVIDAMKEVVAELTAAGATTGTDKLAKDFLATTIGDLRDLYLQYRDNIQLEYVDSPKMTSSKMDNEFFQRTINRTPVEPSRSSHRRIANA